MKSIQKSALSLFALYLVSNPLWASDSNKDGKDRAKMSVSIKAMSILGAEDNGYDPNDGSSYLLKMKYKTPTWNKLKLGIGIYTAGDLFNLTDFETERVARGMFVTNDGSEKTHLGEAYLDYQSGNYHLYGGRMLFKSPLTTNTSSTIPNFHTAFGIETTITPKFKLGLAQITQMSFGARSMTDFGLIGEGTKSAGSAIKTSALGQAAFHSIDKATLGAKAKNTDGITVVNTKYTGFKKLKLGLWNYYADDIANNLYIQADTAIPLTGKKVKLSGQYLSQSDIGDKLAGDLDFNLVGLKVSVGNKKWGTFAAFNKSSGDTAMLNAWGGDPGFTSSIFSRNEYRENVSAFKVGARYKINNKLQLKGGYSNYGQSDTSAPAKVLKAGKIGRVTPQADAQELDIALIWKPKKNVNIKLFHANRTSEYDGVKGKDLTQAHTRLIGIYNF